VNEELQEAFDSWWGSDKNPDTWYEEGQPAEASTRDVAKAAFEGAIFHVLDGTGKSLKEQFALAILDGDDAALFATVDKLIEDGTLPEGLRTSVDLNGMPSPGDRYDTKRGVVIINYVIADSYNVAPQFRVHFRFENEDQNRRRNHYGMTLSRFLSWAKKIPGKPKKDKAK
jgi:hypothetical protein